MNATMSTGIQVCVESLLSLLLGPNGISRFDFRGTWAFSTEAAPFYVPPATREGPRLVTGTAGFELRQLGSGIRLHVSVGADTAVRAGHWPWEGDCSSRLRPRSLGV